MVAMSLSKVTHFTNSISCPAMFPSQTIYDLVGYFFSTWIENSIFYSVTACIRRQDGYCCVQYQICANVINPYTLSGDAAIAILDSNCINDWLLIPGINDSNTVFNFL